MSVALNLVIPDSHQKKNPHEKAPEIRFPEKRSPVKRSPQKSVLCYRNDRKIDRRKSIHFFLFLSIIDPTRRLHTHQKILNGHPTISRTLNYRKRACGDHFSEDLFFENFFPMTFYSATFFPVTFSPGTFFRNSDQTTSTYCNH